MNETLQTLARHIATWVVGLIVAFFTIHLTAPGELTAAKDAANAIVEPLVILLSTAAVIVTRLAMPMLQKLFRRGAGENDSSGTGGLPLLVGWITVSTLAVGTLPACSPAMADAARALPIRLTLLMPDGSLSYSSKRGIEAEYFSDPDQWPTSYEKNIDLRSGK